MEPFTPGYPIDLRLPKQRDRAARDPFGDFERTAARVVARFTGEQVILQDDNRHASMPDVRIDYADGRISYLEVVVDADPRSAELYELIRRRQFVLASTLPLDRVWVVRLSRTCSLKDLENELPPLLAEFERQGQLFDEYMLPEVFAVLESPLVRQLVDFGVIMVNSWAPRDASEDRIVIRPEGWGGPADVPWDEFGRELDALLASDRRMDVWAKLAAREADERHLFLGISPSSPWAIHWALDYDRRSRDLPPTLPRLPSPVTHLWLMTTSPGTRCLACLPDVGWIDVAEHWETP